MQFNIMLLLILRYTVIVYLLFKMPLSLISVDCEYYYHCSCYIVVTVVFNVVIVIIIIQLL